MPKSYSDQEKEYIKNRLKEEAAKCMAQYGIRRTTVDELVKRVKIPKGTFYLFYESKETLLFDVILQEHDLIEQKMYDAIAGFDGTNCDAEQLTEIIVQFYQMAENTPILKILQSDEIELLARKLPCGILEEHLSHDNDMIERIFSVIPAKKDVDTAAITAAFRAIYFTSLHKEETGEQQYEDALRILVRGVVLQMLA